MLAGDSAAAERSLRTGFDALTQMGEQAFLSTTAAFLARAVFAQERVDEAEELAQLSARLAASGDVLTQVLWRGVQARVLARRGRLRKQRRSRARPSRSPSRPTSSSTAATRWSISRTSSRTRDVADEAAAAAAAGLHLHEQKGNLVTAAKIRSDLGVLL